jgi:hypothetical protein
LFLQKNEMHSVVVSDWRAASALDAITASTSYSTKYLGPPSISTRQQRHAAKACGRSFRIRGACGNWQRINLVQKAVPQLQVWPLSGHAFRLKVEDSFKFLASHKDRRSIKMRLISYVGYTPLRAERKICQSAS